MHTAKMWQVIILKAWLHGCKDGRMCWFVAGNISDAGPESLDKVFSEDHYKVTRCPHTAVVWRRGDQWPCISTGQGTPLTGSVSLSSAQNVTGRKLASLISLQISRYCLEPASQIQEEHGDNEAVLGCPWVLQLLTCYGLSSSSVEFGVFTLHWQPTLNHLPLLFPVFHIVRVFSISHIT